MYKICSKIFLRSSLNNLKMDSALERILANNKLAEETLESLKREV